ncbi:MAG: homoserine O-acetyltransferase MetX [Acidimicrobiia bacterium]
MKHRVTLDGAFPLERGGTLANVEVEVRTWGRHRRAATLICHALTGDANVDSWWKGIIGSSRPLDPADRFIVCMNVLGSCYGTTGPTTQGPDGSPIGPAFPTVTIRDMVEVQRATLDQLGVERLELVIGGSMGGMQALEWGAMYPSFVENIVPIGVGASQSAWAIGLSEAQRSAILTDPAFEDGWYLPDEQPAAGLATARMIAMTSYRSPDGLASRFGREKNGRGFAVQSYLQHHGRKLVERFDANSYLTLIQAMDSHDLGRGRGPIEAILRRITARALVIGISTDMLYPVSEVRALASSLPNGRFAVIDSRHGHDAFLIETEPIGAAITDFLSRTQRTPVVSTHGAAWA